MRATASLPEPRRTVTTAVASLPARSVAVRAIPFVPALSGTFRVNVPSSFAVALADVPFASFRAIDALPAPASCP